MEPVTLTDENFETTFFPDMAALRSDNKAAWRAQLPDDFDDQDPEAAPNLIFLLKQNDGALYLCIGYHFDSSGVYTKGAENIRWIYRLEQEDDTFYSTIVLYSEKVLSELKSGTMTYYVEGTGAVEDTVADARMTYFNRMSELTGLSPDGTVLELWHFNYECKPTNKAGAQITVVGGQELTDDGYLNEHWTHYLTVLHYTGGDRIGYQILASSMSNDGLFYNGCGYDDDTAAYLHDVYTDYAGLDRLKMYIPDLLNETIPDGYGYVNQCEARLISGDGYCFYAPMNAWACNPDTEYWYSRYDTGSYFSVTRIEKDIDAALKEWTRAGYEAERIASHYRIVTHEGLSNTVVTLYPLQDGSCYQIETHWLFDGSTEENEWGWNHDRAVEKEAAILQAMTDSFTVTVKILFTQDNADSTLDAALKQLGDTGGEVSLSLSVNGTDSSIYDGSTVINRAHFSGQLREDLVWREVNGNAAPSAQNCILLMTADGGVLTVCESQPMHLWLTAPDGTLSCFKAEPNENSGSAWSLARQWYDEAEYDALLRDVKPQPKSLSWQEAARNWANDYYGAHTKATSGSSFKYTWVKALITPAEDTALAKREQGEIDENTYCFYVEVQFTPESETALYYAMAGNTGECTDPSAPKGAYAFQRCCTIQLQEDGLWHGAELGTGW